MQNVEWIVLTVYIDKCFLWIVRCIVNCQCNLFEASKSTISQNCPFRKTLWGTLVLFFSLIYFYSINFQLGTNHKNKIIPHFTLFTQSFRFTKQTTHLNKDYLKEPSLPKTFTKPFLHINRHKTVDNHTITLTANIQPTIILSSYREFKPGQFPKEITTSF